MGLVCKCQEYEVSAKPTFCSDHFAPEDVGRWQVPRLVVEER